MQVVWIKCTGDSWCKLNTVNLDHEHFDGVGGVYVIWRNGHQGAYVRVGQGEIRNRLAVHRQDKEVQSHGASGTLYVTWARVGAGDRDGVERYLYDRLNPLVGERAPDVDPVEVNLPA